MTLFISLHLLSLFFSRLYQGTENFSKIGCAYRFSLEFSAKMSLRNSFKICNNKNYEGNVWIDFNRAYFYFYPIASHVVAKQEKHMVTHTAYFGIADIEINTLI